MIAANLLAIATEQEGGVVNCAIVFSEIAANHDVHAMPRGRRAQPVNHSLHRFGQQLLRERLVCSGPVQQAGRILRQHQSVALGFARPIDDSFQFTQILFHHGQRIIGIQMEVDHAPRSLCRGDANGVGRRAGLGARNDGAEHEQQDG